MKNFVYKTVFLITALAVMAGVDRASCSVSFGQEPGDGTVPYGVSIGGVDVSGQSIEGAEAIVEATILGYKDSKITLTANSKTFEVTGGELGIEPVDSGLVQKAANYGKGGNLAERFIAQNNIAHGNKKDFALSLTSDWGVTKALLDEVAKELNQDAVDNSIKRENGQFVFVEGTTGIVVDTEKSATTIGKYITSLWDGRDGSIALDVITKEPNGSKEQLMAISDVLGACTTNFGSSGANRAANVRLGTSKLNGHVLYPGEEFSVSDNLESRNAANGYLPAPSYENGTTVDSYGGGVCQISTTLYNAVIRSELEIVKRYNHSMMVGYIKPSMDAAIAEGSLDLVFKNNKDYPIYIEGYTSGPELGFRIYGKEDRPSDRKVTYESETTSTTDAETVYQPDATLPVGTIQKVQDGHTGCTARLWKIVTVNGVQQSKEIFNQSVYRVSNAIYKVGTATDNPEAAVAIQAALATNDKDTIDAAVAQWNGTAAPAPEAPVIPQVPPVPEVPVTPPTIPTVPDIEGN